MKNTLVHLCTCLTVLLLWAPVVKAGEKAKPRLDIAYFVGSMVEARNLTESYVGIARDHLDPKSDAYTTSQEKYAAAYSKYSGWLGQLETAISTGKSAHLDEDAEFIQRGEEASAAAKDFVEFVDRASKTQTRAVTTILSSLADTGLKLWQGFVEQKKKNAKDLIADLDQRAKWKSWSELLSGPVKSQSPAESKETDKKPDKQQSH
jgi:hypothetical protein